MGRGAEYVAIGPADLLEPLQPLLDWRSAQGLNVVAVPLEAVYDQFGHGMPEPQAVQDFMAYAAATWRPAPAYLLLVGDATYDPRGHLTAPEANRLPAFLVQTVYGGETASDVFFGQLDDDLWPEIAVGRIPARNPEQVRAVVDKTLAYEKQIVGREWEGRVLAVADGQSPSFQQDALAFLSLFPERYQTELFAPPVGSVAA
ncbi:MAG: hypothetical protein GTO53_10580, partial [Planctomycetales bacterium]|nr:hypothetical protein [Planctomycetales bacterium]